MVLSLFERGVFDRVAARYQRRKRTGEAGFSLIELLIVIAIILIILSVALPQMSKSRMHAQEMAAIEELGTINKAEIQYYSQFNQYATSLAQLGPPATAGAAEGPQNSGLIPGSLASGSAGGYNFTVTQSPQGYAVSAVPKSFGSTGRRTFYTDQTGIIRQNWTQEPATDKSEELK
jgi:type IV pilus assembly protein PilA